MTASHKRYLDCLTSIFEDCQKHGSTTTIGNYPKTYGVNVNLGASLVKLGIVKRAGTNRKSYIYTWARRKPDATMVLEVVEDLRLLNKNHGVKVIETTDHKIISEKSLKINVDDLLDAFSMLPTSIPKEARKKLAKDFASWKND